MAGSAVLGCRFVKKYRLFRDHLGQFMALIATNFLVRSPQGKRRSGLMIKERRLPFGAVMTLRATRPIAFGKLLTVDVLMAVFALCRRRLKIDVDQLSLGIRRLVTRNATRGTVCPNQRKIRG